ncbi:hypothetical protein Lser_V15G41199 [Lactuca serriola]
MTKKFEMSMIGDLTLFLGLQVKQITDGIFCQAKSIADVLKMYGFSDCKPAKSSSASIGTDQSGTDMNATMFRGMIGSLLYTITSRLDIMFATRLCDRFQSSSKESHLHAVKSIFRYFKQTPNLGLWYPHDFELKIVGYTDSDHGGCGIDHKRTSGGAYMLENILVRWSRKKQTSVACSTAKDEYVAA